MDLNLKKRGRYLKGSSYATGIGYRYSWTSDPALARIFTGESLGEQSFLHGTAWDTGATIRGVHRFCEFTGDATSPWDGPKKERCPHMGFEHCVLHQKLLHESEDGWRLCCAQCTQPIQVKELK